VIFVEGWSKKVEARLMLRQALLLIETPLGRQLFVLSGRSGREYDSEFLHEPTISTLEPAPSKG
jgi:hypothetical protein